MLLKISKKKFPKVLDYLTEIRKILKEARDRIECFSRQMYVDTGVKLYDLEHIIFLFSLALEDLWREKQELKLKCTRKAKRNAN